MYKDINILFQDAMEVMNEMGFEVGEITSVKWNGRLRSTWGKCFRSRATGTYRIELNTILADDAVTWEHAMDTMIHEVLHAHKDRFCHTGEWKRCADMINREYPIYHIERCTSAEEKNVADKIARTANYIVRCEGCGHSYTYNRAGKIVKLIQRYPTAHGCKCSCGSTNLTLIKC